MMSSSEHADTNHRGYSHMDPEYPECDPCETNASDGMLTQENEEMQERVIALEKKVQAQEDEIMCLKSALSDVIRRLQAVESGRGVQNNILPSMPKMGSGSQNSPRRMPMTARSAAPSTRRAMSAEHVSSVQRYSSPTPNRIVPRNHPGGGAGGGGGGGASAGGGGSSRKWTSSPSVNEAMNGHMSPGSPAQLSPVSPMAPSTPTGAAPTSISVSPAPSLTSLTPLSPAYSGEQRASVRRSGSLSSLTGRMSPSPFTIRYKEPIYNPDDKCLRMFLRGRAVNMYAPSSLEDYQVGKPLDAPTQKLRLEWVYGYRGRDARSNLYLLPTGEIVYFVAAVVVLYNVEEQMQRHYLGHNDDVKCLALHPDRLRIATGQVAGHDKKEGRKKSAKDIEMLENAENWPHIRIWNSVNLQTLKVIGLGEFDRAVSCLAFSKADGGQFLAAVDEANEHVLSLWDWEKGEKGHKVTETKSSTEPVLAIEFHPCEKNIIVTCGKGQLSFWNMEGSMLTRKMGIYERFEKPKFVTCLAFAENGDTITGDSNGNIFVWGRDEVEEGTNKITHSMIGAHEGGIFSVCVMKNGLILTGGKDRRIVQWDNNYKKTGQEHELPEMYGPVRMLSQGKGNMVLVGTTKNSILQGSLDFKFSTIVQGHVDELWGLAVHPSQHQFVSTGYDRNLYVWDALTHTTVWCKELPDGAHCACFHPDGGIIVVGTLCGRWLVMDNTAHDIITTHTDGSEILGAMAFSPDGRLLAIGSRDNNIYIYGVSEGGRKYIKNGKCSGHSSFITHLDWSLDSQWLQSNSGDYEILFWNPETCRQVTAASTLRDVEWSSHSCTLGFNVAGIWPEGADGTDVNACARSNKKHLVASADDFGKVNLYTYPCSQPKSTATIYNGHSSHVTNVNFLCDDSRLLSTGGKDTAILQWEVMD